MPDWAIRTLVGLGLLACVWLHGCSVGKGGERGAHQATKAAHAEVLRGLADKARVAADKALRASEAVAASAAAADQKLRERTDEANRLRGDLAAALRRGDVRLQDRWACPVPGAGEGSAGADAREADAAGRYDSAGRIVAAGEQDAAVIDWLWARWSADRQAVIDGGCAEIVP